MARTVKWIFVGLLVVVVTVAIIFGLTYAYRRFGHWFRPSVPPAILDVIDDSGRIDGDIASVRDSLDSGGRILDELDVASNRSRESAGEIADSSSQLAGQLAGIRDDAERAQAAIDLGWGAKRKLDNLIRRLQGADPQ